MPDSLQKQKNSPNSSSTDNSQDVQVNPITSTSSSSENTSTSETTDGPPPSDNNIITQTDKDGNALTAVVPPNIMKKEDQAAPRPAKASLFQQLFCCFRSKRNPKVKQRSNVQQNATPQPASGRKSISGHTKLLKPISAELAGRKCLALDLDETLVHSSFQPVDNADFIIPVIIEDVTHHVYVLKRPGVDDFLQRMGKIYEIVVYTASLSKYADPLLDKLDIHKVISARLFREHCVYFQGHYVKDMSLLNRRIEDCIIVDNSPMSYAFHPENAIDCGSYIDSPEDIEMWQIADFLEQISKLDDVRGKTRQWRQWCSKNPSSAPHQN